MENPPPIPRSSIRTLCGTLFQRLVFIIGLASSSILPTTASELYHPVTGDIFSESWRWSELDVLSSYVVRQASSREEGILWFAVHGGAVRYDGYEATSYPFEGVGEIGSQDKNALAIHAASSGKVYALSKDFGAYLDQGKWVELFDTEQIGSSSGSRIAEANDGSIWFATPSGLFRVVNDQAERIELASNSFAALAFDQQNRLWLADRGTMEILRYDLDEDSGLPRGEPFRMATRQWGKNEFSVEFCVGKNQRMWVAANTPTNALRLVEGDAVTNVLENWTQFGLTKRNLVERPDGALWVVTDRTFAIYQDDVWSFRNMEDYATWFSFMYVLDQDTLILGGHTDKTYRFNASDLHWKTYVGITFQCRDNGKKEWFLSQDHQAIRHDSESEEWQSYATIDGMIDQPTRLLASRDGTVWASGSHEGQAAIAWFRRGVWNRQVHPDFCTKISDYSPYEDSEGWVYFGAESANTSMTGGVLKYRIRNDRIEHDVMRPPEVPEKVTHIAQSANGDLWLASGAALFHKPVDQPIKISEKFRGNWIDSLSVSPDGTLWVLAWRTGVSRRVDGKWERITLPGNRKGNKLVALLFGKHAPGLWVANTDALSRFDGHSWNLYHWLPELALAREETQLLESTDGTLWINSGSPAADQDGRSSSYKTVRISHDPHTPETTLVSSPSSVMEEGNIIFTWSGVDAWSHTRMEDLSYSYRVNDGAWSIFQRETRAVLDAQEPGSYRFEVRARDLDWNIDPTPASAEFTVTAFVWKQPWFIALAVLGVLTIIGLIFLLVRQRVRHIIAMEEFKIDFFTNISHELRTPLAAVIGPAESMLKRDITPPIREGLEMVYRNARRMLGLVNDLLEFRKVELGMLKYEPIRSDIILFIKDVIYAHVNLWESKHHQLKFTTSTNHAICPYDPDKLQHILTNLVSNAIKYTPDHGQLNVATEIVSAAANCDQLRIIVEDNGPGIDPDHLETIFKPFHREQDQSQRQSGSGIGLAYASELVDLWGGKLSVVSPVSGGGKSACGSRFTLVLPLVGSESTASESTPSLNPSIETVLVGSRPPHDLDPSDSEQSITPGSAADEDVNTPKTPPLPSILIVEDNADFRQFLITELVSEYKVFEAENGQQGLDIALESHPDLVLTDLMMPVMDGLTLCSRLKTNKITSHIPIIVLTAKGSDDSRIKGIEHGADEYFAKPVKFDLLQIRISNLLESRRMLRDRFTRQVLVQPSEITVTPLDEEFLRRAIAVVEEHMRDEEFDVEAFSREMGMGRASLYRKMNAIVGEPPFHFIRTIRLKRAAQLLDTGSLNVSEAMEQIGINGLSHFGKLFRDQFGVLPSVYRNRAIEAKEAKAQSANAP